MIGYKYVYQTNFIFDSFCHAQRRNTFFPTCLSIFCDTHLNPFTGDSVLFPQLTIVGEKIGIAALVLSLLALIVALTILCLLVWQRFGDTRATCNTAAKGKEQHFFNFFAQIFCDSFSFLGFLKASPGPGKAPK